MPSKAILSLDGGGSHALIQLSVLACFEEDIGASTFDFFDMIAGSSSGGLLTCLMLGRNMSAAQILDLLLQQELMEKIMKGHWTGYLLNPLQIRPKYQGASKSMALTRIFGNLRLSSVRKRLFIPCFNLSRDRLDIFTNDFQPDLLLSEIADACTAIPSFYPPIRMEDGDWRIDGGIGMNNPGLSAYLQTRRDWNEDEIKMLSIGSGWRSFEVNGSRACKYGGLQWSAKGIASIILREKMQANVRATEEIMGERVLYINHYLKAYGMPDHMDSAHHPSLQQKAQEIGRLWYEHHRRQIHAWLALP